MLNRMVTMVLCLVVLASPALAGLSPSFNQSGSLGLEVTAAAGGNFSIATGSLSLNMLPPAATIVSATLYANDINNGTTLDAVFNASNLGSVAPFASDASAGLTAYAYQWNVTSLVAPGTPAYSYTIGQNSVPFSNQIGAVVLVVVWQDASEPTRTVAVMDGIQQVGEAGAETEMITFTSMPAGTTTVWVATAADDSTASGESVIYNSSTIGGPIDQNLGMNASLLKMSAVSTLGNNKLSITTGSDHMLWMIGAVAITQQTVSTKQSTWGRIKSLYHSSDK